MAAVIFKLSSVLILNCVLCKAWVFTDINIETLRAIDNNSILLFDDNLIEYDDETDLAQERISLIYPGTKWCGSGNIANGSDNDLGPSVEADRCCRDHDHCSDIIEAGSTRHNLTNTAFYSRLNCACDEQFRQCLRAAKTKTAKTIGILYFNALATQCFKVDYLIVDCKRRGGWLSRKCLEYVLDTKSEKRYQWFDVPNY